MDDYKPVKMKTVGAYEAKTSLSAILDDVERGVEYIITRHGKEVARVTSVEIKKKARGDDLIKRMEEARKGSTLGGIPWKELRDTGRRFLD